jgi:cold shock CspA family protein
MSTGVVQFFDGGWGKILAEEGGELVFVLWSDILGDPKTLIVGEPVEFEIVVGDRGPRAINARRLEERVSGKVDKWNNGFGFVRSDGDGQTVFVHHTSIMGSGFKTLDVGEDVEYAITTGERGLQAVRVTRRAGGSGIRTLEAFAGLGDFNARLSELEALAAPEEWAYRHSPSYQPLPVLRNYVAYTFERLIDEGKVEYATDADGQIASSNTGLVTTRQEEIFALFRENKGARPGTPGWQLQGFFKESDRRLTHFANPAQLANYFEDPSELLYDPRFNLVVDMEHVIGDNKERFPQALQDNEFALQGAVHGAINAAKKRVRRNYKTAIPQFFHGRLQLLLPLCLTSPEVAENALVVSRENQVYRASTVLTLDMAYNNARLIARPDREWLEP